MILFIAKLIGFLCFCLSLTHHVLRLRHHCPRYKGTSSTEESNSIITRIPPAGSIWCFGGSSAPCIVHSRIKVFSTLHSPSQKRKCSSTTRPFALQNPSAKTALGRRRRRLTKTFPRSRPGVSQREISCPPYQPRETASRGDIPDQNAAQVGGTEGITASELKRTLSSDATRGSLRLVDGGASRVSSSTSGRAALVGFPKAPSGVGGAAAGRP